MKISPLDQAYITEALRVAREARAAGASINPEITAAQSALESTYGRSGLSVNAHNFLGIYAGRKWKGPTLLMPTKDYVKGKLVTIMVRFRVYDSMLSCFMDLGEIIRRLPWYQDAENMCGDPVAYLKALLPTAKEPGWCPRPTYEADIMSIARKFGLLS